MKKIDFIFISVFIYAIVITYLYFGSSPKIVGNNDELKHNSELYQDSLLNAKITADSLKIEIKSAEDKIASTKSSIKIITKQYEIIKTRIYGLPDDSAILYFNRYLSK